MSAHANNLWKRIDKQENGCWLWTGALMGLSPRVWHEGVDSPAWVALWFEVKQGEPEGRKRGTTCGQSLCVNPDHQRLSMTTRTKTKEALGLHRQGMPCREVARHMGISPRVAARAIARERLELENDIKRYRLQDRIRAVRLQLEAGLPGARGRLEALLEKSRRMAAL